MSILVFLSLSVLDLGPMYATDRRQTRIIFIMPPPYGGVVVKYAGTCGVGEIRNPAQVSMSALFSIVVGGRARQ